MRPSSRLAASHAPGRSPGPGTQRSSAPRRGRRIPSRNRRRRCPWSARDTIAPREGAEASSCRASAGRAGTGWHGRRGRHAASPRRGRSGGAPRIERRHGGDEGSGGGLVSADLQPSVFAQVIGVVDHPGREPQDFLFECPQGGDVGCGREALAAVSCAAVQRAFMASLLSSPVGCRHGKVPDRGEGYQNGLRKLIRDLVFHATKYALGMERYANSGLDDIDRKILAILQSDCRITMQALAEARRADGFALSSAGKNPRGAGLHPPLHRARRSEICRPSGQRLCFDEARAAGGGGPGAVRAARSLAGAKYWSAT